MTDEEIITAFRVEGSRSYAFNLLVRKYQQKLYWLIRRMVIDADDADDLAQNVWIKVWQNLDGFKAESQLYTWLYRIATNEALSFLDKKKKRFFIPLVDVEKELNNKIDSDNSFSGNEIQLKLQKGILTLPEKQRIVFQLRYYDEMPYEEMAKVLDTSVGALKASYHHAAKKIENYLIGSN
jgi:RNA polymerase sigma factor (sigma-70 family)